MIIKILIFLIDVIRTPFISGLKLGKVEVDCPVSCEKKYTVGESAELTAGTLEYTQICHPGNLPG
jgi:hypothetical protein